MKIFETDRLEIRELSLDDADYYFDMMSNPNVMNPIPREVMSRNESDEHLKNFVLSYLSLDKRKVWAIQKKDKNELIGLCAFLKNDENEDEIGYRLREKYWRNGFGTEIAKGLISFGFEVLKMEKITADVDTRNLNSVKILDKLMTSRKEFYNKEDNCLDRRYEISKNDWN